MFYLNICTYLLNKILKIMSVLSVKHYFIKFLIDCKKSISIQAFCLMQSFSTISRERHNRSAITKSIPKPSHATATMRKANHV